MRCKIGSFASDLKGQLGGQYIQTGKNGASIRTKRMSGGHPSSALAAEQYRFAAVVKAWRSLSLAQIRSWNAAVPDFARTDIFGDIRNPSGFELFTKLNLNRLLISQSFLTYPPAIPVFPSFTITDWNFRTISPSIYMLRTSVDTSGFTHMIYVSQPTSPTLTNPRSTLLFFDSIPATITTAVVIIMPYIARFGVPPLGSRGWLYSGLIHTASGIRDHFQLLSAQANFE